MSIDFTVMYAAHDAFRRDLDRLANVVAADRASSPRVRAGWANFKHQLRIHHIVEDTVLWPRVQRAARGMPSALALLREMAEEHSRIDPLLAAVDAGLGGAAGLLEHVEDLRAALDEHLGHEERSALPLVRSLLTPEDWEAFTEEIRRRQGAQGTAVFVPWVIDGIAPTERSRFLATLPPPVRSLNRLTWERRYRKLRLWAV
ncbi:hemerythrin domain-containing protein [Actinomadura sp. SCN-SB]|uniref:hemerythrin domain-containing protein n=1 Tax=Actinomadura sp. SCN-SB TaxID=3373092 RepID=UPI00375319D3